MPSNPSDTRPGWLLKMLLSAGAWYVAFAVIALADSLKSAVWFAIGGFVMCIVALYEAGAKSLRDESTNGR